jgi:two-component system, NarL family, nitrate/nitrite response regulator NarL
MTACRVVIVDDHPLAREGIRSLLESDPTFVIVGEACNGLEAVELCKTLQPDLVLMDIKMPKMNGLDATKEIKTALPHVKVVILSISDDVTDLFQAIQYGAQGYLLKNLEPDDWLRYLHALMGEDVELSREMAYRLFHRFRVEEMSNEPKPDVLTPREREILMRVAAGETNRQISERLFIAENTVKNHIKNILEKLRLENRVQLASYAVRQGLFDK